ncbi:MAG: amino acid--tRNA ligase-related protein [Acutalibacteraceae bacterium]
MPALSRWIRRPCARARVRPRAQRHRAGQRLGAHHRSCAASRIFGLLGLSKEEANENSGFARGVPLRAAAHCGIGLGLDRLVMQLLGADSLRDVIAFPKVQNASRADDRVPGRRAEQALRELGITTEGNSLK